MWWKMGGGALLGLIAGHFLSPGYALWVVIGIVVGYLVDILGSRQRKQEKGSA